MVDQTLFQISISGASKPGVIVTVADVLFNLGANLEDSFYNTFDTNFDFVLIVQIGPGVTPDQIIEQFCENEDLSQCTISVRPYEVGDREKETDGKSYLHLVVTGGDRPGLVLRISELLLKYGANIIRMTSQKIPRQSEMEYCTRFYLEVDTKQQEALKAAIINTSGSLSLDCHFL